MNQVEVGQDMDRVMLYVREVVIPLPYAAANIIASKLLSASSHALRTIHEDRANKAAMLYVEIDIDDKPIISAARRGTMPGKFEWKIDIDSERVILFLGDNTIPLHFSSALKLSQHMKIMAKRAKGWAGDTSKQWICTGHLTDAEENYRLGI